MATENLSAEERSAVEALAEFFAEVNTLYEALENLEPHTEALNRLFGGDAIGKLYESGISSVETMLGKKKNAKEIKQIWTRFAELGKDLHDS